MRKLASAQAQKSKAGNEKSLDKKLPKDLKKRIKKVFRCQICRAVHSSDRNVKRHMAAIHFKNELKKMYGKNETDCRICSKTFVDYHQLLGHIATVHDGVQQFLPLQN